MFSSESRILTVALYAISLSVLCAGFMISPAMAQGDDENLDTIKLVDGPPIRNVEILREEHKNIRYRIGKTGPGTDVKTDQVAEIHRNSLGPKFKAGESSRRGGKYEEAIKNYKAARSTWPRTLKLKGEPVITFWIAECNRLQGKIPEAKKGYDKFLKNSSWKKHRFVPAVYHGQALMALGKKPANFGAAEAAFRKLAGGSYGTTWKLRGLLGSGRVLFRKRSYDAALSKFKGVERDAKNDSNSALEQEAKMWQGKCLLKGLKYKQAEKFFKKITDAKKVKSKEVMAAAWNGLGIAYTGLSKGRDKTLIHKALMAHLRVALVYSGFRNERREALKLAVVAAGKLGLEKTRKELKSELETIP